MAFSKDSSIMSDILTSPAVKVSPVVNGGTKRVAYGHFAAADLLATTVGQTHSICRLPGNARVTDLRAENASMGNGAFDFDLYAVDGTQITSAGAFLADFPLTAHSFEGRVDLGLTPANAAKDLATLFATEIGTAGKTGDVEFDLVATVVTVSTGASVVAGFQVEYVTP